jgi:hypothetical protein
LRLSPAWRLAFWAAGDLSVAGLCAALSVCTGRFLRPAWTVDQDHGRCGVVLLRAFPTLTESAHAVILPLAAATSNDMFGHEQWIRRVKRSSQSSSR